MSESDLKRDVIKISLLGNQNVGKTTIRNVFLNQEYSDYSLSTVGVNKANTYLTLDNGNKIKLIIWDTAGQERFHSISLSTIKNSQGVILIFDVTNRESFNDLNVWINEIKNATDKVSVILFGNKCDMEKRDVSEDEAKSFAFDKEWNLCIPSDLNKILNQGDFADV